MRNLTREVALLLLSLMPFAGQASEYRVHNIGSLVGSPRNIASAINSSGEVTVGSLVYDQGDMKSACVWKADTGIEYVQIPGTLDSVSDINDAGDVVGNGHAYPDSPVLRQTDGSIVSLNKLPGMTNLCAYAGSINNAGQIAGGIGSHAVFWDSLHNPVDISGDNGLDNGTIDLNNNGQVLWSSTWMTPDGVTHIQPYVWTQSGGSIALALPEDGSTWGITYAINDRGVVVGRTGRAVKWLADGSVEQISTAHYSEACGINNKGQIVGHENRSAVLWDSDGSIIDLGSMLSDHVFWSGGYESYATDINENGWITGYICSPDLAYYQAIVWQPVPEPTSLLALAAGIAGLVIKRRR